MGSWFRNLSILVVAFIVCTQKHQTVGISYDNDDAVERGDKYIDTLLDEMLEQNGHEYDPYVLDDSAVGFWKKITFVNVSGEAKLHNGYITGLKSLHRPDHCSVEEEDDKLLVKADLGAGVLDLYYDGTVKFMNFGPTINVHGVLSYLEVHMEFTVDAKTGRQGKLTKFVIDEMKGMTVKISGLGPMNWALNYLMSGITSLFKGFVRKFMQNKIRNHIAEKLPNYQFPVEGGDIDITEVPEITEEPEEITDVPEETEEPEEEIPEETEAPEEEIPEETEAPEEEIPEETEAPEEEIPEETEAPEEEIPEETEEPEEEIPEETEAPEEEIPEETEAPEEEIPEETEAPEEEIPEETEVPEEEVTESPEEEVLEAFRLFELLDTI